MGHFFFGLPLAHPSTTARCVRQADEGDPRVVRRNVFVLTTHGEEKGGPFSAIGSTSHPCFESRMHRRLDQDEVS